MITNAYRVVKLGLTNFWRNGLLSMAATLILTITLFTISIFIALILIGNSAIQNVSSRIDIIAYFKDNVKETEIMDVREDISVLEGVRYVEYISKEKAYEKWQGQEQDERLEKFVTRKDNPLPRSLEVRMADPEQTNRVADFLQNDEIQPLLHNVKYNQELIENLNKYIGIIKRVGIGLVSIFVAISVLVVFNTIRLAIYARRDEIDIMKLVGATSTFIRAPFLVEGILFGVAAAIFASLIVLGGVEYLQYSNILTAETSQQIVQFLGPKATQYLSSNIYQIFAYQAIVGVLVSLACSWAAIYKYLSFKK
jgi:cell division transport system permease protein